MQYDEWNEAIGRYFFGPEKAGMLVFLTVDPETLHSLASKRTVLPISIREAVEDFSSAVHNRICRMWPWWHFSEPLPDCYPDLLGLIAIQVLAVYKMQDSGDWTGKAYWIRLRELLKADRSSYMPLGLKPDTHQWLWEKYADWVNRIQQGRWGYVQLHDDTGGVRHIQLPKSQALLRLEDLNHLDRFFGVMGLQPDEASNPDILHTVADGIGRYKDDLKVFSSHARRVLADQDRFWIACEQIVNHLELWDGVTAEEERQSSVKSSYKQGRRIWLDIRKVRFSNTCELKGGLLSKADHERLPDCLLSEALARPSKFGWKLLAPILTVWDEMNRAFVERRTAAPGEEVVTLFKMDNFRLCFDDIAEPGTRSCYYGVSYKAASSWLPQAQPLSDLPDGWLVIRLRIRENLKREDINHSAWNKLVQLDGGALKPVGGLRLSRQVWMEGAGPEIEFIGSNHPTRVWINGQPTSVGDNSLQSSLLDTPGVHRIVDRERHCQLRIKVESPSRGAVPQPLYGWRRSETGWPEPTQIHKNHSENDPLIIGPAIRGEWPSALPSESDQISRRQYLDMAVLAGGKRPLPVGCFLRGEAASNQSQGTELFRNLKAAARHKVSNKRTCYNE